MSEPLLEHDLWQRAIQNQIPRDDKETTRAARAIIKKFDEPECSSHQFFMRKMPKGKASLSQILSEAPADTQDLENYDEWHVITTNEWMSYLASLGLSSAFEILDLNSDLTLLLAVFIDSAYADVPLVLKLTFALLTFLSLLLAIGISLGSAYTSRQHVEPKSRNTMYLILCTFLNWISTPVFLMVAPQRLAPYGQHFLGRNVGYSKDTRGLPVVCRGNAALVSYLSQRTFRTQLPKVFFENILLFALTVYMQQAYVKSWGAAAIFSVTSSALSLLYSIWRTVRFFVAARRAKLTYQKIVDDTAGYETNFDKTQAQEMLSSGAISYLPS